MKDRVEKMMDKIAAKKQKTLFAADADTPVEPVPKQQKKKSGGIRGPSYWACAKGHIFRHNFHVNLSDIKRDLRCPECDSPAKNRVNENTYLDYRKRTGRVNIKMYQGKKKAEAERKMNRM